MNKDALLSNTALPSLYLFVSREKMGLNRAVAQAFMRSARMAETMATAQRAAPWLETNATAIGDE